MKILAISDPHGDYSKMKQIIEKAGDFDLAVVVGDITHRITSYNVCYTKLLRPINRIFPICSAFP